MIAFSSDIDWAPDEILEDFLSIFEENGIKCTVFCTHASHLLKNLKSDLFDFSIHPNFLNQHNAGTDYAKIIDSLLNIYPDSKGVRAHDLFNNTTLMNIYAEHHLLYEASLFLPYQRNIDIFPLWNGLIRVPFNWEDDIHFQMNKSFSESGLEEYFENGINIFNFHPVHVYLNTEVRDRYLTAKKYYQNPKQLREYRNKTDVLGVRDLLIRLIKYINLNSQITHSFTELIDHWKKDLHAAVTRPV